MLISVLMLSWFGEVGGSKIEFNLGSKIEFIQFHSLKYFKIAPNSPLNSKSELKYPKLLVPYAVSPMTTKLPTQLIVYALQLGITMMIMMEMMGFVMGFVMRMRCNCNLDGEINTKKQISMSEIQQIHKKCKKKSRFICAHGCSKSPFIGPISHFQ